MSERLVLGVGELLWDCFADERRPGGAPANVAFHAGQLGERGIICSRVGDDYLGRALLKYLTQRGLSTEHVQRDPLHPTGTVTVDAAVADDPTYTIHEGVAWDHLEFTDELDRLAGNAAAVCFGTLAQRGDRSRATIERLLESARSALIVYDVNLRPPWIAADVVNASLQRCHVFKLNDDEVVPVAEMLSTDSAEPFEFAGELLRRFDLRLVCITRGGAGVLAFSPDESITVPGRAVAVADTVGAGDAFTAGLIHGLLEHRPLNTAVQFANEVGALVAGRSGAMPPLRDEYAALADAL